MPFGLACDAPDRQYASVVVTSPLLSRVVHGLLALGTVVAAVFAYNMADPPPTFGIVVVSACLVYVFTRGAFMGVVLSDDDVVVRGLIYSRKIPIRAVTSVTSYPAVRWASNSGRARWTPISALMAAPRNPEAMVNQMSSSLYDVRLWIRDHQGYTGSV